MTATVPAPGGPNSSASARPRHGEFTNEALGLVGVLLAVQLLPRTTSPAIYVAGVVASATVVLHGLGIVLVYRANRFVNFAQLQLGVLSGVLFVALVQGQILLDVARGACGCIDREPKGWILTANFVLAVLIAVATATVLSYVLYTGLLRRFTRSTRLMLTLFTVFAAQAMAGAQATVVRWFVGDGRAVQRASERSTLPSWDFTWRVGGLVQLQFADVFLVAAAAVAVVGIGWYLRTSETGVSIRAAAESPARAETLGVDVVGVTSRVWLIAGLLAGVAGVVGAFGVEVAQRPDQLAIPVDQLALLLLVAVLARFSSLPMVAAGALTLGVLRQAVQHSFGSSMPLDATLVFLVGALLLVQRGRQSRADREEASEFEVSRETRPIPRELRHLPQVRAWMQWGVAAGVVVLLVLPWALARADIALVSVFLIFSIVGLSLLVVTGWSGQVSLGQFGFAAIGAWTAAVSGLPMPIAVILGGLVGAVAAVVVGLPALRLRGLNLAISTLAFAVSAQALFIDDRYLGKHLPDSLDRPSLLGTDLDDERVFYYFTVLVVVALASAVVGLRRSRIGRALIAIRANEATGQTFGLNAVRIRLAGFGVGGFLAAFAGALLAFHQHQVLPDSFSAGRSVEMFMYSVIGGLGGIAGAFFGFGFMWIVTVMTENPLVRYAGTGTGAMLLLLVAPGGLSQLFYDTRDSALRRLAVRLRIPVPSLMGDRAAAHMFDRALLDEGSRGGQARDAAASLRYDLPHQWALDRYGRADIGRRAAASSPVKAPS